MLKPPPLRGYIACLPQRYGYYTITSATLTPSVWHRGSRMVRRRLGMAFYEAMPSRAVASRTRVAFLLATTSRIFTITRAIKAQRSSTMGKCNAFAPVSLRYASGMFADVAQAT